MNRKNISISILGGLVVFTVLSACGPSQEELDATSTQAAANQVATQTAKAPTATQTPTDTPTPTITPTVTPVPTNTPTVAPSSTLEVAPSPELYPTPTGLSPEGQEAYNNIAHVLLTMNELDEIFGTEEEGWGVLGDAPGLYMTCRTFIRPDTFIHTKFFSCVSQAVTGFDLEKDDSGLYEVFQTYESAYAFDYPQRVNAYFTESGRLGIDYIVQIEEFIYITGMELVTPIGYSVEDMFGEFEDKILYETLKIMVTRAEGNPPDWLEFPPGTSSRSGNQFTPYLVDPVDLDASWEIGDIDEIYEDNGACRWLVHESGPPPVIYNCIAHTDFYSLDDKLNDYTDLDYVDVTKASRFSYDDPFVILIAYLDNTEDGYPEYSIFLEKDGVFFTVNLINPYLSEGTSLEESFTPEIDNLINMVLQMNLSGLEGQP